MQSLFVSHGAPNLVLHNSAARAFLAELGTRLTRPKAVLVVSAHFEADRPTLTSGAHPPMIYDFRGFEPELREIVYAAPGAPDLAAEMADRLREKGFDAALSDRGFDHGVWVPLVLAYPDADIPVLVLSVNPGASPADHLALGEALAPFVDDGVLVIGSGALTHNLGEMVRGGFREDSPAPDWVREFGEWMEERARVGAVDDLIHYRERAPHAVRNHPTEEHVLPFFVALGAAGTPARAERIHTSHAYGVLQMDAYAFRPFTG